MVCLLLIAIAATGMMCREGRDVCLLFYKPKKENAQMCASVSLMMKVVAAYPEPVVKLNRTRLPAMSWKKSQLLRASVMVAISVFVERVSSSSSDDRADRLKMSVLRCRTYPPPACGGLLSSTRPGRG